VLLVIGAASADDINASEISRAADYLADRLREHRDEAMERASPDFPARSVPAPRSGAVMSAKLVPFPQETVGTLIDRADLIPQYRVNGCAVKALRQSKPAGYGGRAR